MKEPTRWDDDPDPPLDPLPDPSPCECEMVVDDAKELTHYRRGCPCGAVWWGLHCPHDGHQNPCPGCGKRAPQVMECAHAE